MQDYTLPKITEVNDLQGKRVLLRAGLNVPVEDGIVTNRFRVQKAAETIQFLSERGAIPIVVAHIGRDPETTLEPVAGALVDEVGGVRFVHGIVGEEVVESINAAGEGDVLVLENVRCHTGEKKNDPEFAKLLASYADIYVNDAFAVAHRADASVVGVPAYLPHYAGILFEKEIAELSKGLTPPEPSLLILGGSKFETKEALLHAALKRYTKVFVGGALANDFFRARGLEVGISLTSEAVGGVSDIKDHERIMLPSDVVVEGPSGVRTCTPEEVGPQDAILDVGPASVAEIGALLNDYQFVLWNGPLGNYERGFTEQTEELAGVVAASHATSIVGGGDTIASIEALELGGQFSHLSTGGGAMLDFLVDGHLPAIDALRGPQPST